MEKIKAFWQWLAELAGRYGFVMITGSGKLDAAFESERAERRVGSEAAQEFVNIFDAGVRACISDSETGNQTACPHGVKTWGRHWWQLGYTHEARAIETMRANARNHVVVNSAAREIAEYKISMSEQYRRAERAETELQRIRDHARQYPCVVHIRRKGDNFHLLVNFQHIGSLSRAEIEGFKEYAAKLWGGEFSEVILPRLQRDPEWDAHMAAEDELIAAGKGGNHGVSS